MDDPVNPLAPSTPTTGPDAAVILSLLAKMRNRRDVPVIEEPPVEGQVPVIAWGRWPW